MLSGGNAMSEYNYKSKDEIELLRRAKMGDVEALDSLIFALAWTQ